MARPVVAIVGRPNVGKSTLFNHITGRRISIVDDTPGITRDRIYAEAEWRGRDFTLIDTGGIEPASCSDILKQMRNQALTAVETADVIIFMTDARTGVTVSDAEVSNMLRKAGNPVVMAVNKVDRTGQPPADIYEFYSLGIDSLVPISSANGLGIGDLLDEVYRHFPEDHTLKEVGDAVKIAVVGKPNTGKSSLINRILSETRLIVSDIPGTTREAVDTQVNRNGRDYILIDTAGIRRKSRITENIERYSTIRSWTSIERADVCLLLIDASEGAAEQDAKIAGFAHEKGKASIIAVNKWDLAEKGSAAMEECRNKVIEKLSFMTYAPIAFISAKTGKRVEKLFGLVDNVYEQASIRVSTGVLNDIINDAIAMTPPPADKGKRLRIYYAAQTGCRPPAFVMFVNSRKLMHFSYKRYIENCLRDSFGFEGTPIRIIVRERNERINGG